MKLLVVVGIFGAMVAAQTFPCAPGRWGACCNGYDPGEKECFRGEKAKPTNTTENGWEVYSCANFSTSVYFTECCSQPSPLPSASVYTKCTPPTNPYKRS